MLLQSVYVIVESNYEDELHLHFSDTRVTSVKMVVNTILL